MTRSEQILGIPGISSFPMAILLLVGSAATFLFDVATPMGYAVLPVYFLLILGAALTQRPWMVIGTGSLAVALAATAPVFKELAPLPPGAMQFSRVTGCLVMAIITIVAAGYLRRSEKLKSQRHAMLAAVDEHEATRRMVAATRNITRIGAWTYHYHDNPQKIIEWTDAVAEIHGLPAGTHPTSGQLNDFYDADDAIRLERAVARARETGDRFIEEVHLTTVQGERRVALIMGELITDETGEVVALKGVTQDVTVWRDTESVVETHRRRFNSMASSMPIVLWTARADGTIDYFNDALARYTGIAAEELTLSDWAMKIIHPDDIGTIGPLWRSAQQHGRDMELDLRIKDTSGDYRWHRVNAKAEIDERGEVTRWWGCAMDIHDAHQLRQQLSQAQRLESVGRLTGGIAHDFNNLLTVVVGAAEEIEADPELSAGSREMAHLVLESAERGAELTHRLLAFARRQPLDPQSTDIDTLLNGALVLIRRALGDGIKVETHIDTGLPLVRVDPGQLEHALINLAINARDAMSGDGELRVTATTIDVDPRAMSTDSDMSPGAYVAIAVSDSGSGIDPANLSRLFDPFFTTKGLGEGSGLGLPLVWGFAKQSGGNVTVESELGHGATFTLYLPVAEAAISAQRGAEAQRGATGQAPASAQKAQEPLNVSQTDAAQFHILVVEDDPLVRTFACEQLRQHGYRVSEADSGPRALAILRQEDPVDLLFTDVIMPGGMTGKDLAERACLEQPDLPVLFTSGFTDDVVLHRGITRQEVNLVPKPYSGRALIQRVFEALHRDMEVNR